MDVPITAAVWCDAGMVEHMTHVALTGAPDGPRAPRTLRVSPGPGSSLEDQRIQYESTHADAGILGTRAEIDAYLRRQEAR